MQILPRYQSEVITVAMGDQTITIKNLTSKGEITLINTTDIVLRIRGNPAKASCCSSKRIAVVESMLCPFLITRDF